MQFTRIFRNIIESDVWKIVAPMKSNAAGTNVISPKMVKYGVYPSIYVINNCLRHSVVACRWKKSLITPLMKNNKNEQLGDLRPGLLVCCWC